MAVGAVAVSPSHPEIVWVGTGEATCRNSVCIGNGVYKSCDGGKTWRNMGLENTRHIAKIIIDPFNPDVVYIRALGHLWGPNKDRGVFKTENGGKTFTDILRGPHPDHHVLWVDPANSRHIISGNDGGIDISWDAGKTWHAVQNSTWAEVYQLGFDMRDPYYVYAGLQDNGIWGGPINSLDKKGILNRHWYPVSGGDGFYAQVDPENPDIIYGNAQMGKIGRFHLETGELQSIIPPMCTKPKILARPGNRCGQISREPVT